MKKEHRLTGHAAVLFILSVFLAVAAAFSIDDSKSVELIKMFPAGDLYPVETNESCTQDFYAYAQFHSLRIKKADPSFTGEVRVLLSHADDGETTDAVISTQSGDASLLLTGEHGFSAGRYKLVITNLNKEDVLFLETGEGKYDSAACAPGKQPKLNIGLIRTSTTPRTVFIIAGVVLMTGVFILYRTKERWMREGGGGAVFHNSRTLPRVGFYYNDTGLEY